jgi:hypothetical protein
MAKKKAKKAQPVSGGTQVQANPGPLCSTVVPNGNARRVSFACVPPLTGWAFFAFFFAIARLPEPPSLSVCQNDFAGAAAESQVGVAKGVEVGEERAEGLFAN